MNEIELPVVAIDHNGNEVKLFVRPKVVGQIVPGTIRVEGDSMFTFWNGNTWQNLSDKLDVNQALWMPTVTRFDIPEEDTTDDAYDRAMAIVTK